ncbi:hypothetical protein [Nocardia grenadensis]|uniref:hypothetical protein n=1 Tax=Nocardia grenadensis TaxID=931537 RepID=UPI0007A3A6CB|nr:hypothetical protein [Nocardia grenadensis]
METVLTNLRSLGEVTLAALVLGAGLPMVFALGVRLWSAAGPGATVRRNPVALAGAYLCLITVLAVVVAAVLFVAKAFLADRLGIHVFGQA